MHPRAPHQPVRQAPVNALQRALDARWRTERIGRRPVDRLWRRSRRGTLRRVRLAVDRVCHEYVKKSRALGRCCAGTRTPAAVVPSSRPERVVAIIIVVVVVSGALASRAGSIG